MTYEWTDLTYQDPSSLENAAKDLGLTAAQYRFLADRHFGVGADQILTVRPSPAAVDAR